MKKIWIFVFFVGVFVLSANSQHAHAQFLDVNNIPELSSFTDELPESNFLALTDKYNDVPLDDKHLAYEMRLPKGWVESAEGGKSTAKALSKVVLGEIARFYGPSDFYVLSRFSITATELQHQISVRNWFINHVITNGYVLQGMKVISRDEVEALYVLVEGDASYTVRTKVITNGSRVIIVSYYVPNQKWEQEKAMQERVINSFKFLSPWPKNISEKREHKFLDLVSFEYPASWSLTAPNINSIEDMEAKLTNSLDKVTLSGEIKINLISTEIDTTLSKEVEKIKEEIGELELKVTGSLETPDDYNFEEHIRFKRVEAYSVADEKNRITDHEFWLAIMVEDRYYYIITMLSPSREKDFYKWAINTEALKSVLESMGPITY